MLRLWPLAMIALVSTLAKAGQTILMFQIRRRPTTARQTTVRPAWPQFNAASQSRLQGVVTTVSQTTLKLVQETEVGFCKGLMAPS